MSFSESGGRISMTGENTSEDIICLARLIGSKYTPKNGKATYALAFDGPKLSDSIVTGGLSI